MFFENKSCGKKKEGGGGKNKKGKGREEIYYLSNSFLLITFPKIRECMFVNRSTQSK